LLKTHKNKKKNKFIVSERQYIGITATINDFRSTLASCEEGHAPIVLPTSSSLGSYV
jgi:hypothetical protein